jgi:hypothetical protein
MNNFTIVELNGVASIDVSTGADINDAQAALDVYIFGSATATSGL